MKKVTLLAFLCLFACKKESLPPLGVDLSLGFNELKSFKDGNQTLELTITSIEDNRCPVDANCVRAGEVFVDLTINQNKFRLCLDCESNSDIPKSINFKNRNYEVMEVSPLPYLAQPTTQEDKTVRLSIN